MSRAQSIDHRVLSAAAAPERQKTGLVLYATVCSVAVAAILLTNWPTYSYGVRGGVIPLLYYVLAGILVVPILFAHPEVPLRFVREPLFWWFVMFAVLGVLWQVIAQDFGEEPSHQLRVRFLMFFLFSTGALLCSASKRPAVAVVIIVCVLLGGAFNWFDSLRPYRFVPQGYVDASEGRGAGLFINPNIAGAFAVMGTIAALPYIPMRFRAMALTAAVFCVAPTFSRGAFVLAGLTTVAAIALRLVGRLQTVLVLVALPLLVGAIDVAYDYLMSHSEDKNMQRVVQRLMVFKQGAEEDESVDVRADAAARAWELFEQSPLYGTGLGTTTSSSFVTGPHNMYVTLMAEQGIFGLALYLSLLLLLVRAGWRLMRSAPDQLHVDVGKSMILLALYFAANGFFSHNVLDEAHTMFIIGFVVAASFGERHLAAKTPARPVHHVHPVPRRIRW